MHVMKPPLTLREVALPTLIGTAVWLVVTIAAVASIELKDEYTAAHLFLGMEHWP